MTDVTNYPIWESQDPQHRVISRCCSEILSRKSAHTMKGGKQGGAHIPRRWPAQTNPGSVPCKLSILRKEPGCFYFKRPCLLIGQLEKERRKCVLCDVNRHVKTPSLVIQPGFQVPLTMDSHILWVRHMEGKVITEYHNSQEDSRKEASLRRNVNQCNHCGVSAEAP